MKRRSLSAAQGALLLTVLGALSDLLLFLYRVLVSRLAGATVMGLFQLVMPVLAVILSATAVGLTAGTANLTARDLAVGNRRAVRQTLSAALRQFLLRLLPVGLLLIFASDFVSTALLGDARTRLALLLLVPCAALTGVENLHKHVFYGAGLVTGPAVVEVLEKLVRTAAAVGLLLLFLPQYPERAVGLIVAGTLLSEVVSALLLRRLYRRAFPPASDVGPGEPEAELRARLRAVALPVGCNALLGNLLSAANAALIPRLLVAGGLEREAAVARFGVFSGMTLPMLGLPTVFLGALNLVLSPRLAGAAALGRTGEVNRLMGRAMTVAALLALPSLSLMAVIGPDLGRFLFRREGVDFCLLPLAAAMMLGCFSSVLACGLNGAVHHRTVALISLLGGVLQLLFTCLLTPLPGVGLAGCVLGALASGLAELLLLLRAARKYTGLRFRFFDWLLAPGLAAALAALCGRLLLAVLKNAGLPPMRAVCAVILFAALLDLAALQAQGVPLRRIFSLKS